MDIYEKIGLLHSTCSSNHILVLNNIYKTCKEMLTDRGCTHIEECSDIMQALDKNEVVLSGFPLNIKVYFYNEERVGVKFIRSLEKETGNIIIISLEGPTTFTKKEAEKQSFQFFLFKDLCVNITKHKIVPKHELVINSSLQWNNEDLPKIYTTDPVVCYYNFPIDSVIKITRTFGCHEPMVYYRLVSPISL